MNAPETLWHHQASGGSLRQDPFEYVAVGDPDCTPDPDTAGGSENCRFKWIDEISKSLLLPWCCTRELGHQGQHLAGTGEWVAAVHPQLSPMAIATSV